MTKSQNRASQRKPILSIVSTAEGFTSRDGDAVHILDMVLARAKTKVPTLLEAGKQPGGEKGTDG